LSTAKKDWMTGLGWFLRRKCLEIQRVERRGKEGLVKYRTNRVGGHWTLKKLRSNIFAAKKKPKLSEKDKSQAHFWAKGANQFARLILPENKQALVE